MELYKIENVSFAYPNEKEVLKDISISINMGEFVCVCGKSGCGKTTLLRSLKPTLMPHGNFRGEIFFKGKSLSGLTDFEQATKIGFVMQDVEGQIVTDKVWHELAFGLESVGLPNHEIRARVAETAEFFGIGDWFYKNVSELSGGQKQILNLASVMVMQPEILILDEPTSQLDPIAASEFIRVVEKINRELGVTVIMSEHRLDEVFSVVDRVIVMSDGRITADDIPERVSGILHNKHDDMMLALPIPMQIYTALDGSGTAPLTVRDGRCWFGEYSQNHLVKNEAPNREKKCSDDVCIKINEAWFRYEKNLDDVIKGLSLEVKKGEFFAIIGGNGAGKSTALSLMCGINKPYRGKVRVLGKVSQLPQNPQSLFTKKTVSDELQGMTDDKRHIEEAIAMCELHKLLDRHPYDLSGGEMQRTALAKVLLTKPDVLLLDEPTKGLDAHFKAKLAQMLDKLTSQGISVVMVSHDIEFCAKYADRVAMFFDGAITAVAKQQAMFSSNSFYTTAASRMVRGIIKNAVTADDVINSIGGKS